MKRWILLGSGAALAAVACLVPVAGDAGTWGPKAQARPSSIAMDLSSFSDARPSRPLRLLFIHHSVGGQLLADQGPERPRFDSIYASHPNGGGLRRLLEAQGYEVHETSYKSEIGEDTDLFDWLPKFRDKLDKVLATEANDKLYDGGRTNQIVVFKSCYPNNRFVDEGRAPGDPRGPELTVWNARATLTALLPELEKHPDVLFVYLTAPPVAPKGYAQPLWKWLAKTVLSRPQPEEMVARQAALARKFNDWAAAPGGWLKDYPKKNVVVFDYYDILTDDGASNLSRYPTGKGDDSHPSRVGNERAAGRLVPFINRAVRRAGLETSG